MDNIIILLGKDFSNWLYNTNKERRLWKDKILSGNRDTKIYYLETIGFLPKEK